MDDVLPSGCIANRFNIVKRVPRSAREVFIFAIHRLDVIMPRYVCLVENLRDGFVLVEARKRALNYIASVLQKNGRMRSGRSVASPEWHRRGVDERRLIA